MPKVPFDQRTITQQLNAYRRYEKQLLRVYAEHEKSKELEAIKKSTESTREHLIQQGVSVGDLPLLPGVID